MVHGWSSSLLLSFSLTLSCRCDAAINLSVMARPSALRVLVDLPAGSRRARRGHFIFARCPPLPSRRRAPDPPALAPTPVRSQKNDVVTGRGLVAGSVVRGDEGKHGGSHLSAESLSSLNELGIGLVVGGNVYTR